MYLIPDESTLADFAAAFAAQLALPAALELVGDVGVGKTTFTRALAAALGVAEPVSSPSFTISRRYALPAASTQAPGESPAVPPEAPAQLIHYDFYRLGDPGIMRDDLAEALSLPRSLVVIEWGGEVAQLLPPAHLRLEFSLRPDSSRLLRLSGASAGLLAALAPYLAPEHPEESA